tara:strand:+ start:4142 stop:5533 length:1392 start_codon:yes stop_codon:yes gene_type:complete
MIIEFLFTLNFYEALLLYSLLTFCLYQLFVNYLNNKWYYIFQPTTLYALLTLFYCVIGPIISSSSPDGSIIYRATDHREYYQAGLFGAFVSYFSFQIGFNYKNKYNLKKFGINKLKFDEFDRAKVLFIHKWAERIIIFAFLCQFINYGSSLINSIIFFRNLSPIQEGISGYQGSLSAYISYVVNFLIPGVVLMFIALLNGSKERTKFIFYLVVSSGLFITLGFRYRLLILYLPLFLIYFFYKKIKPSIRLLSILFLTSFIFFGLIQITRSYGKGLDFDLNKVKANYSKNILKDDNTLIGKSLKAAFFDSNIFNTSAAIIHITPEKYEHVGLAPILNAIALPIPRKIWPNKPTGTYMVDIYRIIYEGIFWEVGAACLGFAEYYLAGGWIALIAVNIFIGLFYKRIWQWFILNFSDPLTKVIYSLYLSYLYILFSRGYLLQLVFIYLSIFIPIIVFSRIWNKRFN